MKVWVDDERDPKDFLTSEELVGVVWFTDIRAAMRCILMENADKIQVIYLDEWMERGELLKGSDLFLDLYFYCMDEIEEGGENFKKLETIYLHSNDDEAIDYCLEYKEKFKKINVDVVVAPYRNKRIL